MPVYEYRCERCGTVVEVFGHTAQQARPPATCRCGESAGFTRLYSSFAAISAGSHAESSACCGDSGACESPGGGCCGHGHCSHGH